MLDCNVSIQYKGLNAMKEMNAVVDALKGQPVEKFDIYEVACIRDYSRDEKLDLATGEKSPIGSPKCNCVYYELKNGSFVCVRPSGTEPKLKIYYSVKANNRQDAETALGKLQDAVGELLEKVNKKEEPKESKPEAKPEETAAPAEEKKPADRKSVV